MLDIFSRRLVLVTGKGGVGKTALTAALARLAVRRGLRVLVAEIVADDQSPSALSQALGAVNSQEEPVGLVPGIRGVLLTPTKGHLRFLQDVLPMRLVADAAMRSTAVRRFLAAVPAFSEMGVLYRILDLLRQRRLDGTFEHPLCIIDCPATGHALALAQLPAILLQIVPGGPIGKAMREGLSILTDSQQTVALVVTLPESLPVSEALELSQGLRGHGVHIAGMIANRVPENLLTAEERKELEEIVAIRGPILGLRALQRRDRAHQSLARLQKAVEYPLVTLAERNEQGPKLSEAISRELDGF
jgi:anion-transporting  ArsA/GET3 family ATPase